jgi:methyl-accepting chemotaxis protein
VSKQIIDSSNKSSGAAKEASRAEVKMTGLSESVGKIGQVIELINNIASQTNLLSLNATIEAARAGEAGKGFAVVASEVKNLAEQTGKATEEIVAYVNNIQSATKESADALNHIVGTIKEINDISNNVKSAIVSEPGASVKISDGMNQVTSIAAAITQTSSSSEQVLSAASELSQYAEVLKAEVQSFIDGIKNA